MYQEPYRCPNCQCEVCGKWVYRRPYQLQAGRRVYCSKACWRVVNRTRDLSHLRTAESAEKRRKTFRLRRNSRQYGPGWYIEPGKGYKMVHCPDEFLSMARSNGYVLEHRLVYAQHLGRSLESQEVVHHLNGDKLDNRIENLRLYADHRSHYSEKHAQAIAEENHRTRRTASYHLRHKV